MKTILEYLQEQDCNFIAPCNGQKKCGKCKVKATNRIIEVNHDDLKLLTKKELDQGYRLACSHLYNQGDRFILPQADGVIEDSIYLNDTVVITEPVEKVGIIIDIGTTTVAMKWLNLKSGMIIESQSFFNPQGKFGSDVIARIDFDNSDNDHKLGELIIKEIFSRINVSTKIKEILVCGNATMINLFLKEKVKTIGVSPFDVPILTMTEYPLNYFIKSSVKIEVMTMNHISAYVGSDIVMGIYATNMDKNKENVLLMDLGTNGEMVIGNKHRLLATSCPAGPAFEGVNIECGGPSIAGAVCATKVENNKLVYKTIDNKDANSICGSGLISLIANLLRLGIIDDTGNFLNKQKKYYLNDEVYLSIKDIKAFMLAKAAIQAGKEVLLKELNEEVTTIYIAGGFGNYLEKADLVTLNIISSEEANKVQYIKNSAISGLYKLILTRDFQRVQHISNQTKVIYLEKDPDFNDYWIDAMVFS